MASDSDVLGWQKKTAIKNLSGAIRYVIDKFCRYQSGYFPRWSRHSARANSETNTAQADKRSIADLYCGSRTVGHATGATGMQ